LEESYAKKEVDGRKTPSASAFFYAVAMPFSLFCKAFFNSLAMRSYLPLRGIVFFSGKL